MLSERCRPALALGEVVQKGDARDLHWHTVVRQRLPSAGVLPSSHHRPRARSLSHASLLVPPTSPFLLAQETHCSTHLCQVQPRLIPIPPFPVVPHTTSTWMLSGVRPWNPDAHHLERYVG